MPEPSIKGTIFGPVADEVRDLRDRGSVTDGELAATFEAKDIELLETKAMPASWYPMATYARYLDLLCRKEGGGDPSYFERRGSMSAKRLMEGGLYTQLDLLGSIAEEPDRQGEDAEERALEAYRSKLVVVLSLAGSIYNVGRWKVIPDPDHSGRVAIRIQEAGAYSDGMAGAIVGFLDECARAVNVRIRKLYRFERPSPDEIVVRMLHDLTQVREARGKR